MIRFSGLFYPQNPSVPFTLGGFADALMTNTIEPTYWFFFAMFGVTLSVPVLSLLAEQKKILWYMVGCVFVFASVAPYVFNFISVPWNSGIEISVASGYVMYVVLGWLLADKDFKLSSGQLKLLYVAGVACLLIRYGYTYVSSSSLGQVDRLFFDYMAFTAVIPSAALFMWFKNNEPHFAGLAKYQKLIVTVSGASFGVYLIHKLVLDNIVCGVIGVSMSSVLLRTLGPIIIYLVCVLVVLVLKKIPFINKIVP